MKLKQLSLFLENRPDSCARRARRSPPPHRSADDVPRGHGPVRHPALHRPRPRACQTGARTAGMVVKVTEVVPVEVENRPGGLAEVLARIEEAELGSSTCTTSGRLTRRQGGDHLPLRGSGPRPCGSQGRGSSHPRRRGAARQVAATDGSGEVKAADRVSGVSGSVYERLALAEME